jgi:hypothetical protein
MCKFTRLNLQLTLFMTSYTQLPQFGGTYEGSWRSPRIASQKFFSNAKAPLFTYCAEETGKEEKVASSIILKKQFRVKLYDFEYATCAWAVRHLTPI